MIVYAKQALNECHEAIAYYSFYANISEFFKHKKAVLIIIKESNAQAL